MVDNSQVVAKAVVVTNAALDENQAVLPIALFDEDDNPIDLSGGGGGTSDFEPDSTPLTGYVVGTAGAVAATDTLLEAIGKLEARIAALENV